MILAGVSISLVVGDNGVLTQASSASEKTDVAKAKEAVEQAISSCQGSFTSTWSSNTAAGFITDYLNKASIVAAMGGADKSYSLTYYDKAHETSTGIFATADKASAKQTGSIVVNGETYWFLLTQTGNQLGATIKWSKTHGASMACPAYDTDANITANWE